MSFILDALKKSEAERQRQHSPGIASIPESERQAGSRKWIWVLAALLVVNLAVLAGIMLRPTIDSQQTAGQPGMQRPASPQPAPEQATGAPPQGTTAPQVRREPAAQQPDVANEPGLAPASAPRAVAAEAPAQRVTPGLPSLNELQAQGVLMLPEMHLDIHVYSGQPADRFVFVNMKKYTEGATLSEGPAVREITQDGVVLDYQGTRFLLPRE
jgi:general secretion pathway protein B